MCVCIYIYIYIYIYVCVDVYVYVSLCVHGWVGKERILSPASLKRRRSIQKTFLYLYWREDHTKSCACKNMRVWKRRTKDSQEWDSEVVSKKIETSGYSVESETPKQGVGKFGRWPDELAFLVAVWDFHWVIATVIWTYIHRLLMCQLHFPALAVLNPCLSFLPLPVCVFFNFFFNLSYCFILVPMTRDPPWKKSVKWRER